MYPLKSYHQKMYKVGFGSNLWGIISEDSLDKWCYLEGCIEEYGTRELFYIEPDEERRGNEEKTMLRGAAVLE